MPEFVITGKDLAEYQRMADEHDDCCGIVPPLVAEVRRVSAAYSALRERLATLRGGCLAHFMGGWSGAPYDAFVHGMHTVCNVVDAYLTDDSADPNCTHSVGLWRLVAERDAEINRLRGELASAIGKEAP